MNLQILFIETSPMWRLCQESQERKRHVTDVYRTKSDNPFSGMPSETDLRTRQVGTNLGMTSRVAGTRLSFF